MSDTPRTDAASYDTGLRVGDDPCEPADIVVPVNIARDLERELAAMTAERDELRSAIQTGLEVAASSYGLRAEGCMQCEQLEKERDELLACLEWLEKHIFDRYWGGTMEELPIWRLAGPYRHTLVKMRGNTLREAIERVAND